MGRPRPGGRRAQFRQLALPGEFPSRGHPQRQLAGQTRTGVGDPDSETVQTARKPGEVGGDQNNDHDREDD